jgi:hypothetical protein
MARRSHERRAPYFLLITISNQQLPPSSL